jgi:hypothetical protein
MRKPNWIIIGILFGVSLFIGYVFFMAMIGAFFPAINQVSRPLLCDGEYSMDTVRSNPRPGETVWSNQIYCDDKDITFPSVMLTGLIFSLVIFVILAFRSREHLLHSSDFGELSSDMKQTKKSGGKTALERMAELKEMRDKNLISQAEYERKKDEIMKEL